MHRLLSALLSIIAQQRQQQKTHNLLYRTINTSYPKHMPLQYSTYSCHTTIPAARSAPAAPIPASPAAVIWQHRYSANTQHSIAVRRTKQAARAHVSPLAILLLASLQYQREYCIINRRGSARLGRLGPRLTGAASTTNNRQPCGVEEANPVYSTGTRKVLPVLLMWCQATTIVQHCTGKR